MQYSQKSILLLILSLFLFLLLPGCSGTALTSSEAEKQKFIWPSQGKITSGYGKREMFGRQHHNGLDMAANKGKEVRAAADGKVVRAEYSSSYGNVIDLKHGKLWQTRYAHNEELYVNKGEWVKQGDVIAKMGNTGQSTGIHLHFEIIKRNDPVNPQNHLAERDVTETEQINIGYGRSIDPPLQIQLTTRLFTNFESPGINIGYHFSEWLYAGMMYQSGFIDDREQSVSYGVGSVRNFEYQTGQLLGLEFRVQPDDTDSFLFTNPYISFGAILHDEDVAITKFKNGRYFIGSQFYETDQTLKIEATVPSSVQPAIGFGLNRVFNVGLSFGMGMFAGIHRKEFDDVKITLHGTEISSFDSKRLKKRVQEQRGLFPYIVYFALGWNFR